MKHFKNNQAGFSLIELMVVVAIIGILSAIGIPQYAKFQAKARTSEAKVALSALYQAEKAFQLEWNGYTVDLNNVGFAVEGTGLRYVTGFQTAQTCNATAPGMPTETTTRTQSISTGVYTAGVAGWNATVGTDGTPIAAGVFVTASADCTTTSFLAMALGDPRNTPAALTTGSDTWRMSQAKVLTNTVTLY
ncbi:MAG: hypothetical protein A2622_10210 [Bdellovibrionales bacterium RIFCSPHIGHO2_01_FULL_40_29]|nr:MAG: hypothetical protein A2622_10210 [Bdellovibrionales bacterium RIFCSPHIGHO2_01_FULL_40_29]OFZ32382.1 MAG: hypothetical protein A3D17_12450 [Bdellovibrionales bacterium RIFCSPHIGHO2_02_FULL_40_15]